MGFDKQIRNEVRMAENKHWRAYLRREKSLEHLPEPEKTTAVFDDTYFGQRLLVELWTDLPSAFDKPDKSLGLCEIEQLEDDTDGLLGIR